MRYAPDPFADPAQQRELRRWQASGDPHLARCAQVVLWSARGWSVPALGCYRRTIRRCVHALLDAGLTEIRGRLVDGGTLHGSTADSAIGSDPPATGGRLVPVVPLAMPELRRILAFHWHLDPVSPEFFWYWSTWRRYKQVLAMRSHYQKRGAAPPDVA